MSQFNRRKFFGWTAGIIGMTMLGGWIGRRSILNRMMTRPNPALDLTLSPKPGDAVCVLTSRQTEGPFYFPSPERQDITEDRKGKPMSLRLQILRYPDCQPIEGAVVEVWHADAEGAYSGYPVEIARDVWKSFYFIGKNGVKRNGEYHVEPTEKTRFLRGLQRTDVNGTVEFKTIFPGWYANRVPHIHFKVFVNDQEYITSQLYLDNNICDEVYTSTVPYEKYGKCPLTYVRDIVLQDKGHGLLLNTQMHTEIIIAEGKIRIKYSNPEINLG
ncbi:MAG: hypothetical protein IPM42_20485 [Saprospiraceae bacterium]|nr:hypothetical protein [Saprospiraceae bacterium]